MASQFIGERGMAPTSYVYELDQTHIPFLLCNCNQILFLVFQLSNQIEYKNTANGNNQK